MFYIKTIFFCALSICSIPIIGCAEKQTELKNNVFYLHLEFVSRNADLVRLSNDIWYTILPEYNHIISRWSYFDLLSLKVIPGKCVILSNEILNEIVLVSSLRIEPMLRTIDQPSYSYLHIKYIDKDGYRVMLSNGKYITVWNSNTILSWKCSDFLINKRAGLCLPERLYNQRTKETIPIIGFI